MLAPLLGSKGSEKVLIFIAARGEGYAREISQFFSMGLSTTQNQLDKFEIGGILASTTKGRTRLYTFNPRYPFLKELKQLLDKALSFYPKDEREKLLMERRRPRASRQTHMKDISKMTQAEVAAFVQSHLRKHKIYVTLSGGAAVSIYTVNRYVSADVDLVEDTYADRSKIKIAMEEIDFREKNRYFIHPDTQHIIEFPSGPLSVGGEPVKHIEEIRYATGILRVISPTDCVKDRLAGYYFWGDQQSLTQAVLVAIYNRISVSEIKRWSQAEGKVEELKVFLKRYNDEKRNPQR